MYYYRVYGVELKPSERTESNKYSERSLIEQVPVQGLTVEKRMEGIVT